jgi:HD-like signal output (HDOD) protein
LTVIDLTAVARRANDLEPLPATVTRLAALFASDSVDIREVAEVASYDQALAATLIRQANSSLVGGRVAIATVKDAVVRLGAATTLSLATGTKVRRAMSRSLPEYGLEEGDLWRHGVAASLAAELLPDHCSGFVPPAATTAALLHDVGKLVMARFLTPRVRAVLQRAHEEGGMGQLEAEVDLLQIHHGELGGLIVQRWQLPDQIVVGIIHHHTPEDAGDEPVAHAVHIADVVAKAVGAGLETENQDPGADLYSLRGLGMTASGLEDLCSSVAGRFHEVLQRYS